MKCIIKLVNGKWHCYGPDGKNWCAYDQPHKSWAISCAKAHGWEVSYDDRSDG